MAIADDYSDMKQFELSNFDFDTLKVALTMMIATSTHKHHDRAVELYERFANAHTAIIFSEE